jgi:Arc/MetJ-type ribon-helix-helix transcriptional regulator
MKSLTVELPDRLAQELEAMVQDGWVSTEEEAVRIALWEFVRRSPRQLAEQYQLDDVAWALEAKGSSAV